MNYENIIGRKLKSVALSQDKATITFRFIDGFARSFGVEGECCSSSWIEHFEYPDRLEGAELTAVEDSGSVAIEDHPTDDYLQIYHTIFRTTKGNIVLEYRNSSNGYYGGYLIDAETPAETEPTAEVAL